MPHYIKFVLYALSLAGLIYFGLTASSHLPNAIQSDRSAAFEAASDTGQGNNTSQPEPPNVDTNAADTPSEPQESNGESRPTPSAEGAGSESDEEGDAANSAKESRGKLFKNGFGFVLSLILFGILVARDVTEAIGNRVGAALYTDQAPQLKSQLYEEGEELWKKGDYLGAIETFREYLKKHPREIYALRRIAEIYEKDLNNPLAAALEYEGILKHPLPSHRWAWTALHLHNIYVSKLERKDDAIELLKRVATEHPETEGAQKAIKRLEKLGYEIEYVGEESESNDEDEDDGFNDSGSLPQGFRPKG